MSTIQGRFPEHHGGWIRLNTLILLRWTAVAGQAAALVVGVMWFGLQLPAAACLALILASAIANILIVVFYPIHRRLTDSAVLAMLTFDLLQLCAMLLLTGGMSNPFALLVLAPVTIAATALRAPPTLLLGSVTIFAITLVAWYGRPLQLTGGGEISVPPVYAFGHWLALVIGVVFLGLYARRVAVEIQAMAGALFATQIALAREQRLCDLGGVVAAYAHELGTPLATIKLTGSEMADDLLDALPDRPELAADAGLIRDQAERCRQILQQMGRAGKDDLHLRVAPLEAILREAAEPHKGRGIAITFDLGEAASLSIGRVPELIHGLRNLIQNAVDFARSEIWIEARIEPGSEPHLGLRIVDDGPGYPPYLLPRIGDPFISQRKPDPTRVDYEGMGLGLFIAKTLLERTGAQLHFANGNGADHEEPDAREKTGARIDLRWKLSQIESRTSDSGLGLNPVNK